MKDDNLDVIDNGFDMGHPKVSYLSIRRTHCANRVYQIAEQKNLDPEEIPKRIYHCNVYSSDEKFESLSSKFIEQYNTKLVIIDSIISLHRAEFSDEEQ